MAIWELCREGSTYVSSQLLGSVIEGKRLREGGGGGFHTHSLSDSLWVARVVEEHQGIEPFLG